MNRKATILRAKSINIKKSCKQRFGFKKKKTHGRVEGYHKVVAIRFQVLHDRMGKGVGCLDIGEAAKPFRFSILTLYKPRDFKWYMLILGVFLEIKRKKIGEI